MAHDLTRPYTEGANQAANRNENLRAAARSQTSPEKNNKPGGLAPVNESLARRWRLFIKKKRRLLKRLFFRLGLLCLLLYGLLKGFTVIVRTSFEWQIIAGIATVVVCSIILLWKLPKWQISTIKDISPEVTFSLENEARKTLAQILAGIFVIVGIYGTWKTMQFSEEGQVTERFNKAIDQLGSDKIQTRLGAIYSLERLAQDSSRDHNSIMEILAAFVRTNAPYLREEATIDKYGVEAEVYRLRDEISRLRESRYRAFRSRGMEEDVYWSRRLRELENSLALLDEKQNPASIPRPSNKEPQTDVLAVLGVFRRAKPSSDIFYAPVDLRDTRLDGTFLAGAYLKGAIFWHSQLQFASFEGANLEKANFYAANLRGVFFRGANLKGTIFRDARLNGATLDDAELEEADLSEAVGLSLEQVKKAKNYDKAKLPEAITSALQKDKPK